MSDPRAKHARTAAWNCPAEEQKSQSMPLLDKSLAIFGVSKMRLLLIILLVLLLVGSFPVWPYSTGWGYYPVGGFGLLLVIIVVVLFAR